MTLRSNPIRLAALIALSLIASTSLADDPPAPKPIPQNAGEIKPLPPVAIPDDPPPHEGALFDLPLTIDAPDILIVEALEALPGRPITGERLVRPDGTISLGFYGDVYVRGLTVEQAKVKIIHQLRKQIADLALGLVRPERRPMPPLGKPGSPVPESELQHPFNQEEFIPEMPEGVIIEQFLPPGAEPPKPPKPGPPPSEPGKVLAPAGTGKPSARLPRRDGAIRRVSRVNQEPKPPADGKPAEPEKKAENQPNPGDPVLPGPMAGAVAPMKFVYIDPAECPRVFVDFASHNSQNYYVQGDVGVPGRLPFTGKETVLDALNFAGGFIPIAEPTDIHLYRPARGGKPSKDYKIDLDAIHKGDARANLQIFPGDRLIVGRNPIVKKTVQVDRANSLINSGLNTMLQYAFTARSMAAINSPPSNAGQQVRGDEQNQPLGAADGSAITPARRDEMVREWVDFLWSISSKEGGAMLDEKAFREALMKKLSEPTEPKK